MKCPRSNRRPNPPTPSTPPRNTFAVRHGFYSFFVFFYQGPTTCPTTVSELRDGEDRYVRRVKIDDVLYTFSLSKRGDKWGVEWILSEPDSE